MSARPASPASPASHPRQVNNWCRGRAAVPPWAAALAVLLEERSPEAITLPARRDHLRLARNPRRATGCRNRRHPSRHAPARPSLPSRPRRHRGANDPGQWRLRASKDHAGKPLARRGSARLPAPDHPEQAAHAAATHREPNHMNRAERAAPTVLTATLPGRSLGRAAGFHLCPGDHPSARQSSNHDPIADGITAVGVAVSPPHHRGPGVSTRRTSRRPVLPEWSALWVLQVLRASLGHRRPRPGSPQRDHAPSPPIARPYQPSPRRRQRCAVQRTSHPLDGCSPGPAMALHVRRELRFLRKTRPAGRGGANPCRDRRRWWSRLVCSTRRSPGQPATEALSGRLKSQRQIDTDRTILRKTLLQASVEFGESHELENATGAAGRLGGWLGARALIVKTLHAAS